MAYLELTHEQIQERIKRGDLVVYVEEEYGFRQWYWFPDMPEAKLEEYWAQCNVEDHFFSPVGLPGDMVPLPYEFETTEDYDAAHERANADPRAGKILALAHDASKEERAKVCKDFDEWQQEFFPVEGLWWRGHRDIDNNWTAHMHVQDDSYLAKPGQVSVPGGKNGESWADDPEENEND